MAYPREGDGLVADLMPRHHAANAPRSEQLDGDIAAEPLIVCAIDDAHASGADLLQQTVSPKHSAGMSDGGSHRKGVCAIVGWIAFEVNELRMFHHGGTEARRHGERRSLNTKDTKGTKEMWMSQFPESLAGFEAKF